MSMHTQWNPTSHDEYDALKGMDVYTSDDQKIGTVDQVLHPATNSTARDQHFFLVKPGMLDRLTGSDDLYIPATTVQYVGEDRLILETPSDLVDPKRWPEPTDVGTYRRR